ncbi:tRNA epoxyqueuosine(34) reductase QueG [Flavihumibacter profundi]|jgi:epoxyqueuosine reductase|uniref:tRNA epoxyqueuosine(34) reductase QueG n=1 Tax=Flavihumibacter profundi TaxID=2716883 RepID=UPI001CC5F7F5|nr:tRNA epoxyqueuosine(34) reductase QueG [Flavihumibacter profundi]MBZ5856489.1 tRNA epoxyqueuosine(34) reductase QueG [Flavihumibacter profundi]
MVTLSQKIKQISSDLGFAYCGISPSKKLDEDARRLESWLNKGYHGTMEYMGNHFDLRIDPSKLVPGAKSVITLLINYFPEKEQPPSIPRISKYAYGNDYHEIIRGKLKELLFRTREIAGNVNGRGFVDSAPVLERAWARESGLGWVGKNGNLITKKTGSYFFIATLITDLVLDYDDAFARDYCGTCRKCIEACPTDAILENKTINGSQCISYFTIELKDQFIPDDLKGRYKDWIFGCDICQDVCPWNRFSTPTREPGFAPLPEIFDMTVADWESLGEEKFSSIYRHSPLKRAKYKGILRNLHFVSPLPVEKTGKNEQK